MEENVNSKKRDGLSVYQMADGRYGAAFSRGVIAGKRERVTATGKTAEEAKLKLYNKLAATGAIEAPPIVVNEQTPIENLIQEFKVNYILAPSRTDRKGKRKTSSSSRTNENYLHTLKHFETYFKGYMVGQIGVTEINRFFRYLEGLKKNGKPQLGKISLDRIKYVVDTMYCHAVSEGFITSNPLVNNKFDPPISIQKQQAVEAYTKEEIQQILNALRDNLKLYAPVLLLTTTGMRIEELLGLQWKHIDFDRKAIRIECALTTETEFNAKGEKLSRKSVQRGTKNSSSIREIQLLDQAKEVLLKWRNECKASGKLDMDKENFVFGNRAGAPWTYGGFRASVNGYLTGPKNGTKRLPGFEGLRFHRIRHYVGTTMAAAKAGAFNVMVQLGHSKATTTQRYIGHTDENLRNANGAMLAKEMEGII